jgi:ectoine hydroxylase-related dioxygenase (phytanoyl-CoA dioxygenase family)
MSKYLSATDIKNYNNDGVVILRGVFKDWIKILERGAKFHNKNPSASALVHKKSHYKGKFLEDFCNWRRIPEYEDFILHSELGAISAALTQSKSVQFFHDHYLSKEAESGVETPWHQDMPYYCVEGDQTVSFWLPLESREKGASLKCAAGSHKLSKEIRPTSWSNNESFYVNDDAFIDLPDIENGDFEIKQWSTEPGDVIAFNFKTIHSANANILSSISRTLSFRLIGDDVRYRDRKARTSPNFENINQNNGERLREDLFPIIWKN